MLDNPLLPVLATVCACSARIIPWPFSRTAALLGFLIAVQVPCYAWGGRGSRGEPLHAPPPPFWEGSLGRCRKSALFNNCSPKIYRKTLWTANFRGCPLLPAPSHMLPIHINRKQGLRRRSNATRCPVLMCMRTRIHKIPGIGCCCAVEPHKCLLMSKLRQRIMA
jgi:hypothetical protein